VHASPSCLRVALAWLSLKGHLETGKPTLRSSVEAIDEEVQKFALWASSFEIVYQARCPVLLAHDCAAPADVVVTVFVILESD